MLLGWGSLATEPPMRLGAQPCKERQVSPQLTGSAEAGPLVILGPLFAV